MQVISYSDIPEFHNDTKTIKHLGTLLGTRVNVLETIVKMRRDLTLSLLTDGLKRTYTQGRKSGFEASDAMVFEWTIETTMIPRIRFMDNCTDTGVNKTPITFILEKNYYAANDTFALENQQQILVTQAPEKLAPNRWRYVGILVGNDMSKQVDTNYTTKGRYTQYRSNYYPELSDKGATKYMFSAEKHRGHISRHRVGDSWSGDYASVFFQMKDKKGQPHFFQMPKPEKNLLDLFMLSRENHLLFGRSNHDVNGKCLDFDTLGRELPMGDGLIAQYERYCDKFSYNILTTSLFEDAIDSLIKKTGKFMDNNITVICNHVGYKHAMKAMEEKLRQFAINGAWYWTKDKQFVDVGAHYRQYNYNGNSITFTIDTALSEIYTDFGYMIFVDTSITDGRANITRFTFEGREMLQGTLVGMGGQDGRTSGNIATAIDGTEKHILGYSGLAVFNPYAGFIMQENVI